VFWNVLFWACCEGFWLFRAGKRLVLTCSFPKENEQYTNELRKVPLVLANGAENGLIRLVWAGFGLFWGQVDVSAFLSRR